MPSLTTADEFKPEPVKESVITTPSISQNPSESEQKKFRRAPAIYRKLTEVDPENDIRIRIVGTVVTSEHGAFVIDDRTTSKEVLSDIPVQVGAFIRIFARVMPLETGFELRAEIVQNMSQLDKERYEEVFFG